MSFTGRMRGGRIARALALAFLTFAMVLGAVTARAQSAADEKKIEEPISKLVIDPTGGAVDYAVSFDVTNTGSRAGADVAQVYVSEDHASVPRPPQELKGFARVMLDPGQTRRVTVPLDARSFTWYDTKAAAWHADAGAFTIHVSRSSEDPQLAGRITLEKTIVLPVK